MGIQYVILVIDQSDKFIGLSKRLMILWKKDKTISMNKNMYTHNPMKNTVIINKTNSNNSHSKCHQWKKSSSKTEIKFTTTLATKMVYIAWTKIHLNKKYTKLPTNNINF
jgi:hypothetical protein